MNAGRQSAGRVPPIYIGQIDLPDGVVLQVNLVDAFGQRQASFAILDRQDAEGNRACGNSIQIDAEYLPQIQMLAMNAASRSRIP